MFKGIFLLLAAFLLLNNYSLATTIYSINNGSWSNGTNWSTVSHTGPACNCTPASSDSIYINHNIILTKNLTNLAGNQNGITSLLNIASGAMLNGMNNYDIDIRSTGTLVLCGNINARDVIFSNGSSILICPEATFNVNGNFENKNNSNNVTINGSFNVNGTFHNGVGGIIIGSGGVNINSGPVTNQGSTMGCNGNNPCSSYPCYISSPCGTLLPVELVSFGGTTFENYIKLVWATASETNNDHFIIEKSLDAKSYAELGKIKGSGNSILKIEYNFRDYFPVAGSNYYRLVQFDFDGKKKYYDPIEVSYKTIKKLIIHPNPTAGKSLNILVNIPEESAMLEILDLSGNIFYSQNKELQSERSNKFAIEEIKNIPEGLYVIRVVSTSGIQQEKLMVTDF